MQVAMNPFGGGGGSDDPDRDDLTTNDPEVRVLDATSDDGLAQVTSILGIPIKKRPPQAP